MIETRTAVKTVTEVAAKVCDRCGRRAMQSDDPTISGEYTEFLSIRHSCGYGSIIGDGIRIESDLCQHCVKEFLLPFSRQAKEAWLTVLDGEVDDAAPSVVASSCQSPCFRHSRLRDMIPVLIGDRVIEREILNRLVYFADLAHLLAHGQTISGANHLKLMRGPIPENLPRTRHRLVGLGILGERESTDAFERRFHCTLLVGPEAVGELRGRFTSAELIAIDWARSRLADKTLTYLSGAAHGYEPWISHDFGEALDMQRALADPRLIGWMREHGWPPPDLPEVQNGGNA